VATANEANRPNACVPLGDPLMSAPDPQYFSRHGSRYDIETTHLFQPKFDAEGLIPAIVTDAKDGEVLMFAWMNAEALALTIQTGIGHFWSRSRSKIWKKGEESCNFLRVIELRTDCDQDVVWLRVQIEGKGVACHTGRRSCFYRAIPTGAPPSTALHLAFVDIET
jgi:phosphoribosyl-AMP cyclohydrolase